MLLCWRTTISNGSSLRRDHRSRAWRTTFGFDSASGHLVHLHVHFSAVVGDRFVKNHVLPIEQLVLSNTVDKDGVATIAPELELFVLCVRTLLKYRDRDAVADISGITKGPSIPRSTCLELRQLRDRADLGRLSMLLENELSFVSRETIFQFLAVVLGRNGARGALYTLRARLRRELQPYSRHGVCGTLVCISELRSRGSGHSTAYSHGSATSGRVSTRRAAA